jgi:hypothetical protein
MVRSSTAAVSIAVMLPSDAIDISIRTRVVAVEVDAERFFRLLLGRLTA